MVIRIHLDEKIEKRLRALKDKIATKKVSLPKFLEALILLVLEEMEKDEPEI